MTDGAGNTREKRLAARLRENLRRRKDQARALAAAEPGPAKDAASALRESAGPLSKQDPSG